VVIQYSASLATKRLTMLAMISPTSAAIRIGPQRRQVALRRRPDEGQRGEHARGHEERREDRLRGVELEDEREGHAHAGGVAPFSSARLRHLPSCPACP
jgi:hypothetical protein